MMGRMATDIGAAIRARRQQLRLTQRELAERVGVHPSSVVNWEKGRHPPDRNLGALEEVLGISFDDQDEPEVRASEDAAQALDRAQHEIDQLRRLILNQRREGKGNEAKFRAV